MSQQPVRIGEHEKQIAAAEAEAAKPAPVPAKKPAKQK